MKAWEIAAAAKELRTKRGALNIWASKNGFKIDWQDEITGKIVWLGKKHNKGTIYAVNIADKIESAPYAVVTEYSETTIVKGQTLIVSVTFEVK